MALSTGMKRAALLLAFLIGACASQGDADGDARVDEGSSEGEARQVSIEDNSSEFQDSYEGCLEYKACGATLVATAAVPVDEYSDVETPADYAPNVITIEAGETVTWANNDGEGHTVTAVDGSFDSTTIFKGSSWSQQFDVPGEVEYFCVPHPWMRGKIIVE